MTYCNVTLSKDLNVSLWSKDQKVKTCTKSSEELLKLCDIDKPETSAKCYPCSQAISYIFKQYQQFALNTITGAFQKLNGVLEDTFSHLNNKFDANKEQRVEMESSKESKTLPL
mmetsp:Transcript_40492/g.38983  ORF Transcript_40492/g.38983 Transcript_40492/m.38983 type:complete len:114 (+) Transcript_40492:657-998(+)